MENLENMSEMEYDVLRELGNIGAGNATTALSQMINKKVDMNVPNVQLMEFPKLPYILGGPEINVASILITIDMDIDGMMMFVLEEKAAHRLVNYLMGDFGEQKEDGDTSFTEMEMSALKEIGNIIAGAYLYSLSSLTGLSLGASIPYLSIDMAGAVLSVPAIEFGKLGDKALLIQSQFEEDGRELNGYFILIPTLESYKKIFGALGL